MLDSNKSIVTSLISFSVFTLICPIMWGLNIGTAIAGNVSRCQELVELIGSLDSNGIANNSPRRLAAYKAYASRNCEQVLEDASSDTKINTTYETQRLRREQDRIDDRNRYLEQDQNCLTYGRGTYNPATRSCMFPAK